MFKKREEVALDESLILVYQDEVHFQIQTTITSSWFKKGSHSQVKSFPGRTKISYSGFVLSDTGELFVAKLAKFNYLTTIESVREFLFAHPFPQGKKYGSIHG